MQIEVEGSEETLIITVGVKNRPSKVKSYLVVSSSALYPVREQKGEDDR